MEPVIPDKVRIGYARMFAQRRRDRFLKAAASLPKPIRRAFYTWCQTNLRGFAPVVQSRS